jgi:hypothetical protein
MFPWGGGGGSDDKCIITPIQKNGDHEQANNNRPISLLRMLILSKVCERMVHNQMIPSLDKKTRLSTHQGPVV